MSSRTRLASLALLGVLALGAAPTGGAKRDSLIVFGNEPGNVISIGSGGSLSGVELNFLASSSPFPEKFTVQVPSGYTLDLAAKLGDEVAGGFISVTDAGGFATGFGSFVARDPSKYTTDTAAQACAPGTHAAVWALATTIAGQQVGVTVFVDPGTDPGVGYTLQSCPTGLAGGANSSASVSIVGFDLTAPKAAAKYVWRTIVTPRSEPAYEMQALVPLPESVTVTARYDSKAKKAVLTGKVLEGGSPAAGVQVFAGGEGGAEGSTRTKANGSFALRIPTKKSTDFEVSVAPSQSACQGTATLPGGCTGSITVPPDDAFATVWVSVKGGAARAIRAADQRLAERENLSAADFDADFAPSGGGGADPCLNPTHESDLTITGESTSPGFARIGEEPLSLLETGGITRVFATAEQARAAFDREAVASTLRCDLRDAPGQPKVTSLKLSGIAGRVKAFRSAVAFASDLNGDVDLVYLQRGRSVAIVFYALVQPPAGLERAIAAKLASRLR